MPLTEEQNRKIIDAIAARAQELCPGALALIGVYGSFLTGDIHPRSDLDLLILINDERGRQLSSAFLVDDLGLGFDLYCTSWDDLRQDARYEHPHLSKLMDSRIVWCADEKYRAELETLRTQVRETLAAPFGPADYEKAEKELREAMQCFAYAALAETPSEARRQAGEVLYHIENAVALLNKTYFRLGVRRCYQELEAMEKRPAHLCELIEAVSAAGTAGEIKERLTLLMRALSATFAEVKQTLPPPPLADAAAVAGTYEEMVSNWRGKLHLAAETGDRHLALMSLGSFDAMLADVLGPAGRDRYDAPALYDPDDLAKTAADFDALLQDYLAEYRRAGAEVNRYADVDAFVLGCLKGNDA